MRLMLVCARAARLPHTMERSASHQKIAWPAYPALKSGMRSSTAPSAAPLEAVESSAVTGAGASGVFRARELEYALNKDFRAEALDGLSIDPSGLLEDMNATPEYRAHLTMVMARRALQNPGHALSFK